MTAAIIFGVGFALEGILAVSKMHVLHEPLPAILAFPLSAYFLMLFLHLHSIVLPMPKVYRFNSIAWFLAGLFTPVFLIAARQWTSIALFSFLLFVPGSILIARAGSRTTRPSP